jgi:hypothetical protein
MNSRYKFPTAVFNMETTRNAPEIFMNERAWKLADSSGLELASGH